MALVPAVTAANLAVSIYHSWTGREGLTISDRRQTFLPVTLIVGETQHLGVTSGSAALQIDAIGYLADACPLWVERTLYRGDGFVFNNVLGRVPGDTDVAIHPLIA